MSNLDVALAGFWQIAGHWKNGDKAKIELSCEAGSLYMQLSAMLGHPDQPHFPHPPSHPPPLPPTSSCKRKSPSQLRRQDRRRKEAASRVEETVNDLVKETEPKSSEKNTEIELNVTEKPSDSEKTHTIDHNKDLVHDVEPAQVTVSFQCDQCEFNGVSDKGLKQHTRMKHKVTQVDGNTTESEDDDSIPFETKIESINEECFKALGKSETCVVCNKSFETPEECYKHMFLSKSQCLQFTVSQLVKCGLEKDVKEIGIQRTMMKIHGLLPQLL